MSPTVGRTRTAVKLPEEFVVFVVVDPPQSELIETGVPEGPKPAPVIVIEVPGGPLAGLRYIDANPIVVVGGGSSPPESVTVKVWLAEYAPPATIAVTAHDAKSLVSYGGGICWL